MVEQSSQLKCSCGRPVLLRSANLMPDIYSKLDGKCWQCALKAHDNNSDELFNNLKSVLVSAAQSIYFFEAVLTGADFSYLNLKGSAFIRCHLSTSNFKFCDLSDSIFIGSNLDNSTFANATLKSACMLGATTNFSLLTEANLQNLCGGLNDFRELEKDSCPDFVLAKDNSLSEWIKQAWKIGPCLHEGDTSKKQTISRWNLECKEAMLRSSDLTGANLIDCDLRGSALDYSRLQNVDFSYAKCDDCTFTHTSLGGTKFNAAQLDRADFSYACTPDAREEKSINDFGVHFDGARLENAIFNHCYFLQASYKGVNAKRIECERIILGPGSRLSGNFSTAKFVYAKFISCDLGLEDLGINLRDADFSRAYFLEVCFRVTDLESANFQLSRFENRSDYLCDTNGNEDASCVNSTVIKDKLINHATQRRNEIIGTLPEDGGDGLLEISTTKFETAALGEITLDNLRFVACSFQEAAIWLSPRSKCIFKACNFDNSYVSLPLTENLLSAGNVSGRIFTLCSFHNAIIKNMVCLCSNPRVERVILDRCALRSTGFINFYPYHLAFERCLIETTRFEQLLKYNNKIKSKEYIKIYPNLGDLVLRQCRLTDGQYFGYLNQLSSSRWKAEKVVFKTVREIVDKTLEFAKTHPNPDEKQWDPSPDKKLSDGYTAEKNRVERQYIWNMLASNFRMLALPNLESKCLARLKDVDIFCTEPNFRHESIGWVKSTMLVFFVFVLSITLGTIAGAYFAEAYDYGPVTQSFIFIIVAFLTIFGFIFATKLKDNDDLRDCIHKWSVRLGNAIYYYGERVTHALVAWVVVIMVFGTLFWILKMHASILDKFMSGYASYIPTNCFDIQIGSSSIFDKDKGYASSFVNCIYFSTVAFTTLGFGDLQPKGIFKLLTALEACLGAVMMALFVLSFARRTAAR